MPHMSLRDDAENVLAKHGVHKGSHYPDAALEDPLRLIEALAERIQDLTEEVATLETPVADEPGTKTVVW